MGHDLQIDLDVLLPEAHDDNDRCVDELIGVLAATNGVTEAHVVQATDDRPARICLHVEPGRVSLRRLANKARATGAEISGRYGHVILPVRGITHARRAETAGALLRRLPGVLDASVSVGGPARIEFDRRLTDAQRLRDAAVAEGVDLEVEPAQPTRPVEHDHEAHDHGDAGHDHGGRSELAVAAVAAVVYVVARVADSATTLDAPITVAYATVVAATGILVGRDVVATLRARRFDIEVLMLAAAAGAAALGHWSDAALLLVLFSLGHGLEGFAMDRARREITSLGDLAPPTAHRKAADGSVEEIAVDELGVDDLLLVRPNERIPADAVIVSGTTSVDESPVTGESVPTEKSAVADADAAKPFEHLPRRNVVFAGTLNGPRAVEVRVARVASDSTLARVVKMVADAETLVSPSQVLTKRIVSVFVPAVLVLVAALLALPLLAGHDLRPTFLRAMAVLVAASPCALAIATPSAVLAAIARAARHGVLVKGGGPLEDLGRVGTIAFDKTGTLTRGHPQLVAVEALEGVSEAELLGLAAAVERQSDHPLAGAITTGSKERLPDSIEQSATDVEAVIGKGVTGMVDGLPVEVGNASMFDDEVPPEIEAAARRLEGDGITTMIVRYDGRFLGVLGVMDTPRDDAAATVAELGRLGIDRIVMLSGDREDVATAVGRKVGVDEARGSLLPDEKVSAVRELAAADRHGVAMVGDGVNDAPALATANVGIAMGAAGSDIALETADIALMADRLDRLPFTVALARRATVVIRQNLFFSLGVVAVLIPLTILGVGIGPAVIAHEGSTLVVVANALGLLRFSRGLDRDGQAGSVEGP